MDRRHHLGLAALAGLGSLVLPGCAGSGDAQDIGQAGEKAKATRVLEVTQLDPQRFEPTSLAVAEGETVTLRITNKGAQIHEFFLGDQKAQTARDGEMKAMGSEPMKMRDQANGVTVDPGTSKEITWTFPGKGEVQFGCHEPGHYGDGMKGVITVG